MKLFMMSVFLIIIGYQCYRFIQLMFKMNRNIILPVTTEDLQDIRKYPQKPVYMPTYSKQKVGIVTYILMLIYLIAFFILGAVNNDIAWTFYLLFLIPLMQSHNLFNVFAVVDGGLMSGSTFVSWKNIKSFEFIPIDANHKLYGYSKTVNDGYELKVKGKIFTISCLITSDKMKEKLTRILSEHVKKI